MSLSGVEGESKSILKHSSTGEYSLHEGSQRQKVLYYQDQKADTDFQN